MTEPTAAEVVAAVEALKQTLIGTPFEGKDYTDLMVADPADVIQAINTQTGQPVTTEVSLALDRILTGERRFVDAWLGQDPGEISDETPHGQ